MLAYERANRTVAVLCNHQVCVSRCTNEMKDGKQDCSNIARVVCVLHCTTEIQSSKQGCSSIAIVVYSIMSEDLASVSVESTRSSEERESEVFAHHWSPITSVGLRINSSFIYIIYGCFNLLSRKTMFSDCSHRYVPNKSPFAFGSHPTPFPSSFSRLRRCSVLCPRHTTSRSGGWMTI